MSSDAGKAMYPDLAKRETAQRREQGRIPTWGFSAAEAVYGRKEVEPRFFNPALRNIPGLKPATKRR